MKSETLTAARRVAEIDWDAWQPTDMATLCFVRRHSRALGHEVLLIRKKRGLGAGKVNGPGGRLDPGETLAECAARECYEELGVRALELTERGQLLFQFVDGYGLHVHVFVAGSFEGEAHETDEAIPLWTQVAHIPYDEMWQDDSLWLPHMLDGGSFDGRFIFDGDAMLDHDLNLSP